KKWGPVFFSNTVTIKVTRFVRFDNRNQQSQPLDKFVLISEVWRKFIENKSSCYKPRFITVKTVVNRDHICLQMNNCSQRKQGVDLH
ncbi:unnamed protein product, partial [Heterotrigona itama]